MHHAFGATSTAESVLGPISLRGRRVLVTDIASGLGRETARALAARGARVVGTARDLAAAEDATECVRDAAWENGGRFSLETLDLASLASARACADRLVARGEPFDLVVADAGTGHLGHFVLVNRLAPLLGEGARLVSVAGAATRAGGLDSDVARALGEPLAACCTSGAATVLFALAFDRRHRGRGVRAAAVQPGGIRGDAGGPAGPGRPPLRLKTARQAAATSVWAGVVAPAEAVGGRYCEDCRVRVPDGGRDSVAASDRAEVLWAHSEALAGERF